MLFRLIGRQGPIFRVERQYLAADHIPSVQGVSLDGKWQTHARIEDVELVADTIIEERRR